MTYETNEKIPTLTEVRKRERDEQEKSINKKANELLFKAVSYYNTNYPNSTHEIIWEKPKIEIHIKHDSLKKELKSLTEEELHGLYDIFAYFHDERQMPKIEEHKLKGKIFNIVRKILPGATFLDELYNLYKKRKDINKEIKELEDKLDKERKEFEKRLENNKNMKPDYEACEICGKICKSGAGIASHYRSHEENED